MVNRGVIQIDVTQLDPHTCTGKEIWAVRGSTLFAQEALGISVCEDLLLRDVDMLLNNECETFRSVYECSIDW